MTIIDSSKVNLCQLYSDNDNDNFHLLKGPVKIEYRDMWERRIIGMYGDMQF